MKQQTFLLIAGTVYGRKMADFLCQNGAKVYATVATEYGRSCMPVHENLTVLTGRLICTEMEELIKEIKPHAVINAAHPYAAEVSKNAKEACEQTATEYFRLIREEPETQGLIHVQNLEEAANYLSKQEGNIFSACGSKEMKVLTKIRGYEKRVYLRALPLESFIKDAIALGFSPANLICMQGPFSRELNRAMLESTHAKFLITKNAGSAGGFLEKIEAAKELGITTIVIGRPPQQEGYEYFNLIEILSEKLKLSQKILNENMMSNQVQNETKEEKNEVIEGKNEAKEGENGAHYFPMFVSLKGKKAKVFGAGNIGARRIQTLMRFGCEIEIYAPIHQIESAKNITVHPREYCVGDCVGADLVVAATNNKAVNRQIGEECKQMNIPVSVCDDKSLCSFYFPAVIIKDETVIGLTSSGKDHKKVKEIANQIRGWMQDEEVNGRQP